MQTNNVYSGNYTSSIMAEKKHESFFWYAGRLISFIYCNPIRKMFVKTNIGSNAVVTKDIPANYIVGGIPAKVIREIR